MTETRMELLNIIGYAAEVCEPDSKPITAFYTDRHLNPILMRLVEYVETQREEARADEIEQLRQKIIPLLRTSGVKHPSPHTPSDLDTGHDMALDTVLDLLGWGPR